jgi:hypothetical protein
MTKLEKCHKCGRDTFKDPLGIKCHGCGHPPNNCYCEKLEDKKMPDLIKFKLVDRPIVTTKSRFPYEDIIETCKVIPSDKSIPFKETEMSQYHVLNLRKYMKKAGYELRYDFNRRDRIYRIWADKITEE